MLSWPLALLVPCFAVGVLSGVSYADWRTVDRVSAGNAESELAHGFAEHASTAGADANGSYRETSGWMHYSLATFEDTEVTLRLFFSSDTMARQYAVVVEDSVIATRTVNALPNASPSGVSQNASQSPFQGASQKAPQGMPQQVHIQQVDLPVPFGVTKGRSFISITIRASDGITPKLRGIQTVQEHNEFVARSVVGSFFTSTHNPR